MKSKEERLKTEVNVWFVATRADGRPHLTPVWFVWVNEQVWVCTQRNAVKARIVVSRPSVSFALEDGGRPITAEGTARLVEIANAPKDVLTTFRTKYTWDITDDTQNVLIEISVNKWLYPGGTN